MRIYIDADGCPVVRNSLKIAVVLNQDGRKYTNENISGILEIRAVSKKIRQSGGRLKGMPKRTWEQDRAFELSLQNLLHQFQKSDIMEE